MLRRADSQHSPAARVHMLSQSTAPVKQNGDQRLQNRLLPYHSLPDSSMQLPAEPGQRLTKQELHMTKTMNQSPGRSAFSHRVRLQLMRLHSRGPQCIVEHGCTSPWRPQDAGTASASLPDVPICENVKPVISYITLS